MSGLSWGILGTGSIAQAFARAVAKSETGSLARVGSRAAETAQAFVDKLQGDKNVEVAAGADGLLIGDRVGSTNREPPANAVVH